MRGATVRSAAVLFALLAPDTASLLHAQMPAAGSATSGVQEMILTVRANGVERGEFTLLQTPDGDFWLPATELARLKVRARPDALRRSGNADFYSLRALSSTSPVFDEASLAVAVNFPPMALEPTRIDLSRRPPRTEITRPPTSAILNYRASARQTDTTGLQLRLAGELNVRVGEVLLRQEAKAETGRDLPVFARGATQLIWDDRLDGRRVLAGDQLTAGGPFGTVTPAVGVSVSKLYAITPDVVRAPTANFNVAAATPSQVEVAVDGNTVYRTTVAPGPVSVENLLYFNGSRDLRVTVTDATGRRQVYEQPFLFTDTVLAQGLHEYSYFAGRRAELGADDRWHYREGAWQGYHRYGVSNQLTVEASAEGTGEFASGGAGISLRADKLGLLSLGVLESVDRANDRQAHGWSARYSYVLPNMAFYASRRRTGAGFRSFGSVAPTSPHDETRMGGSTRLSDTANLSLDYLRANDSFGLRQTYTARLSSSIDRRTTLYGEYTRTRTGTETSWGFNVYLRYEFQPQHWAGANVRATEGYRAVELEAGKQLPQGEGVGYRVGTILARNFGTHNDFAYGSATWNRQRFAVDLNATTQVRGGGGYFTEAGVSGSLVSVDSYIGATRLVNDGFALARLGVPQSGVDIYLNSQVQGKTDAEGNLLIPHVGAFGRQDVTLDDKQLSMEYNLARKRVTIAPAYKSGTLVNFGGRKLRALTGNAWLVQGGSRKPIVTRAWELAGAGGPLAIETARAGEFYVEDAPPGRYTGRIELDGNTHSCEMNVPSFTEAVHELRDGLVCR